MEPFMTIITRTCHRPKALKRCTNSVDMQSDRDIQHLILPDRKCSGMLYANTMLFENRGKVKGRYVYILDDDDVLTDDEFVEDIRNIYIEKDPDAIFVKGKIGEKNFPKTDSWQSAPKRGGVGSPNIVVKNEVFQRHIGKFRISKAGDFYYISAIYNDPAVNNIWWFDKEVFKADIGHGKPEARLDLDVRTPYIKGKQLGAAYNLAMESVSDWVLFTDHDIILLGPNYADTILHAIRTLGHNAGWITCMTNRIACPHQLSKGAPGSDNIMEHMEHAGRLWAKHGKTLKLIDSERARNFLFSGFFILTHKEAWEKVGGFKDGFLGVDNDYHKKLIEAGYSSYVMPGVYCYHIYHQKDLWRWG